MGMHRTHRRHMERMDAIETKARNVIYKSKERTRRDSRMLETIKAGKPPFAPAVMSWLSRQLDKPSARITPQDIKGLLT